MDRALDEIVKDRQQSNHRGSRDRRPPRDGVRKSTPRDDSRDLNRDWVHDRFDDDDEEYGRQVRGSSSRNQRPGRRSPPSETSNTGAKLRVENLHYDITENDLRELFGRKGHVTKVQLLYDRQDRSQGVAYVTYDNVSDARAAIRDFDGANAHGQPIRLSLLPAAAQSKRNPFDTAERPGRSLFDRVEGVPSRNRGRSDSPQSARRSDTTKPVPDYIDRYVPGQREGQRDRDGRGPRRSPMRGGNDRNTRRPGDRRRREDGRDGESQQRSGRRPKKTAEELDAEMADYWGKTGESGGTAAAPTTATAATTTALLADDDIDMIE